MYPKSHISHIFFKYNTERYTEQFEIKNSDGE